MTRFLIVDDHAIVRRGLIEIILETAELNAVIDESASGHEALLKIQTNRYDLILLDISLPGRNGLEVLAAIKADNPAVPVLMISMYPEDQFAIRAFKSGASGYLTKESAPDELKTAIIKLLQGGKYISPTVSELLVSDINTSGSTTKFLHRSLSDREFSVFLLIATGMSLIHIAEKLALSDKTVSTYRTRILKKMQMKTNADIISYAIKNGLV